MFEALSDELKKRSNLPELYGPKPKPYTPLKPKDQNHLSEYKQRNRKRSLPPESSPPSSRKRKKTNNNNNNVLREAKSKTSLRIGFFLDFRNFIFTS